MGVRMRSGECGVRNVGGRSGGIADAAGLGGVGPLSRGGPEAAGFGELSGAGFGGHGCVVAGRGRGSAGLAVLNISSLFVASYLRDG